MRTEKGEFHVSQVVIPHLPMAKTPGSGLVANRTRITSGDTAFGRFRNKSGDVSCSDGATGLVLCKLGQEA